MKLPKRTEDIALEWIGSPASTSGYSGFGPWLGGHCNGKTNTAVAEPESSTLLVWKFEIQHDPQPVTTSYPHSFLI
jgi:hypothetical protein